MESSPSSRDPGSMKEDAVASLTAAPLSSTTNAAATGYEVARLLKSPENRLCADCSAPLFGVTNTFASLEFGVWICAACAEMHKEELSALASSSPWVMPKPAHSPWTVEELRRMQYPLSQHRRPHPLSVSANGTAVPPAPTASTAGITAGNVTINKVLERYIPAKVWQKITPTSGTGLRRTWIRAKYYSHYFAIPHYDLEQDVRFLANPELSLSGGHSTHSVSSVMSSLLRDDRKQRIDAQKVLPTRLVDYFLILGPTKINPTLTLMKHSQQHHHQQASSSSSATSSSSSSASTSPPSPPPLTWADVQFTVDGLDCYPGKDFHSDTPIPELIGPMVFPHGVTLSTVEKQPFSFTYVLTDINRIKLYGASLIVYELVDPQQLQRWLQQCIDHKATTTADQRAHWQRLYHAACQQPVLYLPKALTLLSQYPFHTLFQTYLARLYHISLSTAPLPLERYILNFVQEVPLPPPGRVEVICSLPGCILSLSRPPPNQLPMVDFSYRPLFAALSVDHILAIFTCLALEHPVCLCASNVALLTPIQEALLSFLFPFVWQGCYVPMLPSHLLELLDAPVPLLVGMHDEYLRHTPPSMRPSEVLFVHVDTDTLSYGERDDVDFNAASDEVDASDGGGGGADSYGGLLGRRGIPALPKAAMAKLRAKLVEHGGHLYRQCDVLLKQAGNPYPHQEQYMPLDAQVFQEQALLLSRPQTWLPALEHAGSGGGGNGGGNGSGGGSGGGGNGGGAGGGAALKNAQLGIKADASGGSSSGGSGGASTASGAALPYRHPAACTVVAWTSSSSSSSSSVAALGASSSSATAKVVTNLLDAQNNVPHAGDRFDAREIREAFLRFWVATLGDYHEFFALTRDDGSVIWPPSASGANGGSSRDGGSAKGGGGGLFRRDRRVTTTTLLFSGSGKGAASSSSSSGGGGGGGGSGWRVGMDGIDGDASSGGGYVFMTQCYADHLQNRFLATMIRGQMFSIFRNENLDARSHPPPPPSAGGGSAGGGSAGGGGAGGGSGRRSLVGGALSAMVNAAAGASTSTTAAAAAAADAAAAVDEDAEPQPAEIRFFDEHIQAKRNRSKLTLLKTSTPFLSDTSGYFTEWYTVPPPSTLGLATDPQMASYAYPCFPSRLALSGPDSRGYPVRKPRVLVEKPEVKRWQDDSQAVAFLKQTLIALQQSQQRQQQSAAAVAAATTTATATADGSVDASSSSSAVNSDPIAFFRQRRQQYLRTVQGIVRLQAQVRMRPLYRVFHRKHRAVHVLIRFYRAKRIWRWLWKRQVAQAVCLVQAHVRRWVYHRRYQQQRALILWLQAQWRQRCQRQRYQRWRGRWIGGQAVWRGYQTRQQQRAWVRHEIAAYRAQIVYLWMLEHTSLRYRAVFWTAVNSHGLLGDHSRSDSVSGSGSGSSRGAGGGSGNFGSDRTSTASRFMTPTATSTQASKVSTAATSAAAANRTLALRQRAVRGYVTMAVYREELSRLYASLHCAEVVPSFPSATTASRAKNGLAPSVFDAQFQAVQQRFAPLTDLQQLMATRPTPTASTATAATTAAAIEEEVTFYRRLMTETVAITRRYYCQPSSRWAIKFEGLIAQEAADRQRLYHWLKDHDTDLDLSSLFALLHIGQRHRRKRKLTQYVWLSVGRTEDVDVSAQIVLSVWPATTTATTTTTAGSVATTTAGSGGAATTTATGAAINADSWLVEKLAERRRRHCVETVHACLVSLQRAQQQQQQHMHRRVDGK